MKKSEMNNARARVRARKKRDKKRRRRISRISILVFVALCFLISFLLNRSSAQEKKLDTIVTLKVDDVEIIQGEEKPVFTAEAVCEGNTEKVLEENTGYTAGNLVDELNRGIGYTLECAEDGSREGTYAIKAELTSEILTPMYNEWFGKIQVVVENGAFTVKNKYGEWDNGKFKLWEGGYAENQFITYQDKTYYLDSSGKKASGWQEIEGSKYYFSKKGVMKTGWMESGEDTYYFDENGAMYVGWLKDDGEKYYFDEEGKMVTGEMKKGVATYTFANDGHLEKAEGVADPDKPMVALTFDDGPGPYTADLLEMLEKNGARATFFMLGQNATIYQDTVKKMADIGCELGSHSYDHPDLTTLKADEIKNQMTRTNQAIANAAGQNATLMRPPYGSISSKVRENVGLPMILWSIDTLDWKTRDAKKTIEAVMDNVQDGDIILMHDIHKETVEAAEKLIPKLQKAGYQLVTVSELAEARGITLENGEKYGRFRKAE